MRRRRAAALVVVILSLAACSGGASGDAPDPTPSSPTTSTTTTSSTTPTTSTSTTSTTDSAGTDIAVVTSALQRLVDSYDNVVQAILADPRVAADRNHQLVADYLALFPEGSAFASGTLDFWASEGAASRSVPPHDPIKRLNDRHQDALLAIARALTPHTDAVAAIALAIDDFGVSLDVKTADGGHRLRYVAFAAPARAGRRRLAFRDLAREAADRLSVRSTGVAR